MIVMDKQRKPNRLKNEKSPYLLQHAYNPVDWYPWTEEAFEKARKEDKPIFLSIGYSTCHWCHVMERESFEDEEVAAILNEKFVCIKVDREERPDIDNIYMNVCVIFTGSGGWPLTIIIDSDKRPFFAGTYFPREGKYGKIGLIDLLANITELWEKNRRKLTETGKKITEYLTSYHGLGRSNKGVITEEVFDAAFVQLYDRFDKVNGGFGTFPKFPMSHNLLFLLRYWKRKKRRKALEMVEKTLQKMRLGGIYDQVGFGFHRYSTDSAWLVPHFEKMLYDQAMMSIAFTEAYQATKKEMYRKTAEEIFNYVLRELTHPKGGFYSSEDADSEGEEGKFYLWTEKEIKDILDELSELGVKIFNISKRGNLQNEDYKGKNILHLKKSINEFSKEWNLSHAELAEKLEQAKQKLFDKREKRVHPQKDDKILTDWNGLMIAALAKGSTVFNEKKYAEAAKKAAEFLITNLQSDEGRLLHRYREGEAAFTGNLDDYAFFIWGLIELYEATFETKYLYETLRFQDDMIRNFGDKKEGGFYFTSDDSEKLLVRSKSIHDGAIPSGTSIAFLNLVKLAHITGKTKYEGKATELSKTLSSDLEKNFSLNTMFLSALDFQMSPSYEIVITGNLNSREAKDILRVIRFKFIPNKTVLYKDENDLNLVRLAEFTRDMKSINGKVTVYICKNFTCNIPITDKKKVADTLDSE